MATVARANIEALLRARHLDTTLTSARPFETRDEQYVIPTGIPVLDERLGGGLARGQLSEIVGPRSSGRTSLLFSAMAGATARRELVALVDTFDTFDASSARACGVDLSRLLWVRGRADVNNALKAFNLILQAGGFDLVAFDLSDASPSIIRRLPFTTWFRVGRPIEGSSTACVLLAGEPVARSAGGVTVSLQRADHAGTWASLFTGFEVEARIGRSRGIAETCRFSCAATL